MEEFDKTFVEEYQGAQEQMEKGRFKNATILFSKALFALCDYLILAKLNRLPKNHTERFRILEEYFPDVYTIADEIFIHYTNAYSKPVLRETSENIKDGIKKIVASHEVPAAIKEAVK